MPYSDPRELEKIRNRSLGAAANLGRPGAVEAGQKPLPKVPVAPEEPGPLRSYFAKAGQQARDLFAGQPEQPRAVDVRTAGGQGPAATPAEAGLAERGGVATMSRPGQPPGGKMDYTAPVRGIAGAEGLFRTDVAPDGQGKYGKAIYSDSAYGATRQGLDAAIAKDGQGASGGRDYYAGVDVSGMSDEQYAKFKIDKMKEAQSIYDSIGKSVPGGQSSPAGPGRQGPGSGITVIPNSRLDDYKATRARWAREEIPTGLSRGRKAKMLMQRAQLEEGARQFDMTFAADQAESIRQDQRARAATAADLLGTQYDAQVDAAKLANDRARTAISGQNLLRQQQEFAAKAPARQLETFEAINAGADLASETLNDRPILKETGVDAGSLYKQIATRVGDPAQANTLLQGFLTSVQERDKLARDAGKKPLDAEVLTLELEDFLGNL